MKSLKKKTLHRHLHPIHWHGSMILAILAILLTATKASGELLNQLEHSTVNSAAITSTFLRDAETRHTPVLVGFARNITHASD